jgi:hypothetical protein
MGKKEFDEYIQYKTVKPDDSFKERELREWFQYITVLYGYIKKWLSDYIQKNDIKVEVRKKKLYEEFSGEYEADSLELTLKNSKIIFEPVGTMLIGAKGRVDIKSVNGTVSLILVDKKLDSPSIQVHIFTSKKEEEDYESKKKNTVPQKIEWVWKVLVNNDQMRYVTLNEENFFDILMELIHG